MRNWRPKQEGSQKHPWICTPTSLSHQRNPHNLCSLSCGSRRTISVLRLLLRDAAPSLVWDFRLVSVHRKRNQSPTPGDSGYIFDCILLIFIFEQNKFGYQAGPKGHTYRVIPIGEIYRQTSLRSLREEVIGFWLNKYVNRIRSPGTV